jgi:RNA polymerase sigma factor (sigma-70 family)
METDSATPYASELAVLDSVITAVTRSRRMRPEDADDLRQSVHLRLAERDFDVFRRFNGRSSLRTYLIVVVHRMLLDSRNHEFGKWRPSTAAKRHGAIAILLDRLVHRDGYSVEEAIEHLRASHGGLDVAALRPMAAALPMRQRAFFRASVSAPTPMVAFDDPVEYRQRRSEAGRLRIALARALAGLARDDRRVLWLRYRRNLTVPIIAARLQTEPKLLYRRLNKLLLALRRGLTAQGITGPAPLDV